MTRLPVAARVLAGLGAVAVVMLLIIYVVAMRAQGDEVPPGWLVAMGTPGVLALVAAFCPPRLASVLLVVATLILGTVGLLSILTIGVGFLVVATATGAAALIALTPRPPAENG